MSLVNYSLWSCVLSQGPTSLEGSASPQTQIGNTKRYARNNTEKKKYFINAKRRGSMGHIYTSSPFHVGGRWHIFPIQQ